MRYVRDGDFMLVSQRHYVKREDCVNFLVWFICYSYRNIINKLMTIGNGK